MSKIDHAVRNALGASSRMLCFRHDRCAAPRIATYVADDHESTHAVLRRWNTWSAVLLDEAVAPNHQLILRVTDPEGAPLNVTGPHFVDGDAPPMERMPHVPEPIGVTFDDHPAPEPIESRLLRLAEIESLNVAPAELAVHGWMWWHLDVNTHQDLLRRRRPSVRWPWGVGGPECGLRSRSVEIVAEWLAQRIQRRWEIAQSSPDADLATIRAAIASVRPRAPRVVDRHLSWIEVLLRTVIAAHHPPAGSPNDSTGHAARRADGPDPRSWSASCLSFALGDLQMVVDDRREHGRLLERVPMTLGHPDSVAFVLLAELALAAIEAELAPRWWRAAAGPLVAAIDPYAHAWGHDGTPCSPLRYDAPPHRTPRPTDDAQRHAWRQEMAGTMKGDRANEAAGELERSFGHRLRRLLSEPLAPDSPWARRGRS